MDLCQRGIRLPLTILSQEIQDTIEKDLLDQGLI